MTIDHFTKEYFEQFLTLHFGEGWNYAGCKYGEHSYTIPVPNTNKRFFIRSSIRPSGHSASTGRDSIKAWIEYFYASKWFRLKDSSTKRTYRVPGWEDRLIEKLHELARIAKADSRGSTSGEREDQSWIH